MFVRIQQVMTPEDREALYRFRYRVYSEELGKDIPGMDEERKTYCDELDETGRLIAAVDSETGVIVGTLRSNILAAQPIPERLSANIPFLRLAEAFGPDKVAYSSAFMVDPAYRGKTAASLLVLAMYRHGIAAGVQIDVCIAELALVHVYYQLGYRPFAAPFRVSPQSGLRVPLILCLRDRSYLEGVDSPLRHQLAPHRDDHGDTASRLRDAFPEFKDPAMRPLEKKALWAAMAFAGAPGASRNVFEGLDAARMDELLKVFPTVKVAQDEHFYRTGEHERGMGIVLTGQLGVTLDPGPHPHYVAIIGPGELCGEMSALLQSCRTANLRAIEDTEVLLLPFDLLEKLQSRDPDNAVRLSHNINQLLSRRLASMNQEVVRLHRRSVPEERMEQTVTDLAGGDEPSETEIEAAPSYSISTLDDPTRELERLERQARIGWDMELYWLRKCGLPERGRILDLGSGPGVTSMLLAEAFPEARIVGVEPDGWLRDRAEGRARAHALSDRIEFLDGTGEKLPLPDQSVDAVYARFLLQHLRNPVAVLAEARRVLRAEGMVMLTDVDDEGVVVHPEPQGLRSFQKRAIKAQRRRGGDRHVGRKLLDYLTQAGFRQPQVEVVPLTSRDLPLAKLVDAAFGFKLQVLKRAGLWRESDAAVLDQLYALADQPGAWMLIPVFFGHGRV